MSEKEKTIVEKIKAIKNMSDFEKGYLLGKIGSLAATSCQKQEEHKEHGDQISNQIELKEGDDS